MFRSGIQSLIIFLTFQIFSLPAQAHSQHWRTRLVLLTRTVELEPNAALLMPAPPLT